MMSIFLSLILPSPLFQENAALDLAKLDTNLSSVERMSQKLESDLATTYTNLKGETQLLYDEMKLARDNILAVVTESLDNIRNFRVEVFSMTSYLYVYLHLSSYLFISLHVLVELTHGDHPTFLFHPDFFLPFYSPSLLSFDGDHTDIILYCSYSSCVQLLSLEQHQVVVSYSS